VERISDLLSRAVRQELHPCHEAADLYNHVFKDDLGFWSKLTARCQGHALDFRSPPSPIAANPSFPCPHMSKR
jgi:hypothetical protein